MKGIIEPNVPSNDVRNLVPIENVSTEVAFSGYYKYEKAKKKLLAGLVGNRDTQFPSIGQGTSKSFMEQFVILGIEDTLSAEDIMNSNRIDKFYSPNIANLILPSEFRTLNSMKSAIENGYDVILAYGQAGLDQIKRGNILTINDLDPAYPCKGLFDPSVIARHTPALNAAGISTKWKDKTGGEIYDDVRNAIETIRKAFEYSGESRHIPNVMALSSSLYSEISRKMVGDNSINSVRVFDAIRDDFGLKIVQSALFNSHYGIVGDQVEKCMIYIYHPEIIMSAIGGLELFEPKRVKNLVSHSARKYCTGIIPINTNGVYMLQNV